MSNLELHFEKFRNNIIGIDANFKSPFGDKKLIYADWIASGRLFGPIEEKIQNMFGPFVGNTHSESSITGNLMTSSYHKAQKVIKSHVNAGQDDIIISAGFGMTAVVNKLQRILGLRISERYKDCISIKDEDKPIVFITHMEHHSNQTSWLETIADVKIIEPDNKGLIDLGNLNNLLNKYKDRKIKIGAFTAASNVTGITTDYHKLAKIMHQHDGLCFIDFAASAPYVKINMHPEDPLEKLDAIYFSPHKFLGGPGTAGVLIMDKNLDTCSVPDHPGGGTVDWTNPWGQHKYVNDVEAREDGGTPGFLQTIRTALCIKLKDEMGAENILKREEELVEIAFSEFSKIPQLHILASEIQNRLGVLSFYIEDIHYNLAVKILNDRYGIQVRGGCSCAGTYGHYLLHVDPTRSQRITDKISKGDLSEKPGWIRMSLHPTMTNDELITILNAIKEIIANIKIWEKDYIYDISTNEYHHVNDEGLESIVENWFS
ncbi:MAG: aminotransferase class V-fold PLP-dependent enzyme [Ignavibacteriales bacterium]|nr:aminotransferase class V-fold PLP-dependent enzyme [Ignavibacteriales bacterium]MCB9219426.1 aminotransferase class V-fold PLP-dependent enzyme [Ignavibacteriales bacterium]MCB9259900.1 aminotransferase class V-fold PLP-dependent enzyme [Ignavibacteriales bacterium]